MTVIFVKVKILNLKVCLSQRCPGQLDSALSMKVLCLNQRCPGQLASALSMKVLILTQRCLGRCSDRLSTDQESALKIAHIFAD